VVKVGHTHQLDVIKALDFGFYLDAKELGEVLLPNKHAPNDLSVGDKLACLLIFSILKTALSPPLKHLKQKVGEFAYLKCVARTHVGAFLDWGLEKTSSFHSPNNTAQWMLISRIWFISTWIKMMRLVASLNRQVH